MGVSILYRSIQFWSVAATLVPFLYVENDTVGWKSVCILLSFGNSIKIFMHICVQNVQLWLLLRSISDRNDGNSLVRAMRILYTQWNHFPCDLHAMENGKRENGHNTSYVSRSVLQTRYNAHKIDPLPLGCVPSTCTLSDVHAFAYDLAFVLVNILKTDLNAICFFRFILWAKKTCRAENCTGMCVYVDK